MDLTIDVEDYKLNVRATVIIEHNGKILVHRNVNSNHYALMGGRVKIGEDSETTVKREVMEELGKKIEYTLKNIEGEDWLKYEWLDISKIDEYPLLPTSIKSVLKENKFPVHKINKDI